MAHFRKQFNGGKPTSVLDDPGLLKVIELILAFSNPHCTYTRSLAGLVTSTYRTKPIYLAEPYDSGKYL